ncbi:hypothetical protein HT102_04285 [Hoyosella sp. G463]|uniref:Uncharacterized protein n=1 Tax=Lolliginicoccus lacisalsi TaxID=2742202 RepID=A0A927JAJ6_9ACTN|nr:hypothetical protein [Lolliginicoccus lacisalsi]MBD8505704.1 hypothetical protein [Lolliginicoccus lacisalsi]
MTGERQILIGSPSATADLGTFLTRALRLDDAAVVRITNRGPKHFTIWSRTGFDVLAARTIPGRSTPADLVAAAEHLLHNLRGAHGLTVDPGYSLDSAWQGALPPHDGFTHIDDIPASRIIALAEQGQAVAREHGSSQGPPVSLLDQEVITVTDGADVTAAITMRSVFAVAGMGFVPRAPSEDERVRVRHHPAWTRIDARYGSIYARRASMPLFTR